MQTVCLVACTSRKSLYPAAAEFVYRSPLFAAARAFAHARCDRWFILSAKHGLLAPGDEIAPYDVSLHMMSEEQRKRWAHDVHSQISANTDSSTRIVFLAGAAYRDPLEGLLLRDGRQTAAPLASLGIGSQVAWLQKVARERDRLRDIDRLYELLGRLKRAGNFELRPLAALSASSVQPKSGVYFFFESGERRMTAPFEDRVTRIGTHSVSQGSMATLWGRLRTHRGGRDGGGNHRGSIFRSHVGGALINRSGLEPIFPTWGVGQSAPREVRASESEIELEVSRVVGEMPVCWIEVGDRPSADSDRTYIERNLISMLSGPTGPIDLPSGRWLGRWSTREAIRQSGMWNINHLGETYDVRVLNVLERYVEIAEGVRRATPRSLAPRGWRRDMIVKRTASQLELLGGEGDG